MKLGADVDGFARSTLDTIAGHFLDGGFRHDSAWNCYGPYLTLQLAHAFLLIGDVERMDQCLRWIVPNYDLISQRLKISAIPIMCMSGTGSAWPRSRFG